jgi:hypothetical protein
VRFLRQLQGSLPTSDRPCHEPQFPGVRALRDVQKRVRDGGLAIWGEKPAAVLKNLGTRSGEDEV